MARKTVAPAVVQQANEEGRIEYIRIDELSRWPANPKQHDTPTMIESAKRFGFVAPLIKDEGTGRLVAGHGRAEALEAMRAAGTAPPQRIRIEPDGMWSVPVFCGISFASESEAEAYLLADNRLVELGGWNDVDLNDTLKRLNDSGNIAGVGWSTEELASIISDTGEPLLGPDVPSAKTPADKLEGYMTSGVRMVQLHYSLEEYQEFVRLCERLRPLDCVDNDNNAAYVLRTLRKMGVAADDAEL